MTMHAFGRWQGQQQWNSCAAKYVIKRHAIIMEVSNILSFPEIFHSNLRMILKNAGTFMSKYLSLFFRDTERTIILTYLYIFYWY